MDKSRQFDTLYMSPSESIARTVTVPSSWGTSPTSPTCKLFDGDTEVTADNLSGSASVSGSVITTAKITGLTMGKKYVLKVFWEDSGNTLEAWGFVICE